MKMAILYFISRKELQTVPFVLTPNTCLSYKGSLEMLARNRESKRERLPAKSKAGWSRGAASQHLGLPWPSVVLSVVAAACWWGRKLRITWTLVQNKNAELCCPAKPNLTSCEIAWTTLNPLWQPQRVFPHFPS